MEINNIHQKLFRVRRHLELSQENVANELGITPEAYGKIERGKTKISIDRLTAICKIFGLEPWQVIKLSSDELIIHLINTPPPVKISLTIGRKRSMPILGG